MSTFPETTEGTAQTTGCSTVMLWDAALIAGVTVHVVPEPLTTVGHVVGSVVHPGTLAPITNPPIIRD